jgi:hypothetical protein
MAIKIIETGIFSHYKTIDITEDEAKSLLKDSIYAEPLEAQLEKLRVMAFNICKKNGAEFYPGSDCIKFKQDLKPELYDANNILAFTRSIPDMLKKGEIEKAVLTALVLGQISVKLFVRPSEPLADTGRRVRRKNAENLDSEAFKEFKAEKNKERMAWGKCALAYRKRRPYLPKNDIYRHVAQEFSVKFEAVKKQLQKMKALQKVGKS